MTTPARHKRPSIAGQIAAIVRAGLVPKVINHPDGRVEVTGLPVGAIVPSQDERTALDKCGIMEQAHH